MSIDENLTDATSSGQGETGKKRWFQAFQNLRSTDQRACCRMYFIVLPRIGARVCMCVCACERVGVCKHACVWGGLDVFLYAYVGACLSGQHSLSSHESNEGIPLCSRCGPTISESDSARPSPVPIFVSNPDWE